MEKISSRLTFFNKVIVIRIAILLVILTFLCYFIFNLTLTFLYTFLIVLSPFFVGWFIVGRRLETVYKEGRNLIINHKIIKYENITSIGKYMLGPVYQIDYEIDNKKQKIIFLPKFLFPFLTHSYIKDIQKNIKDTKIKHPVA